MPAQPFIPIGMFLLEDRNGTGKDDQGNFRGTCTCEKKAKRTMPLITDGISPRPLRAYDVLTLISLGMIIHQNLSLLAIRELKHHQC